jgi:RNA polymerase sigma-70 factor (ECF subfamily)
VHEFTAALYREHAGDLITALALSINDRDAAQDLAHEVFLRALAREAHLRRHPDPRGWLFRTGYNLARSRWRLLSRRRHAVLREHPILPADAWDDAIDLRDSLQTLSPRQRDAVILHYYLGFPEAEVAPILGCAPGSVRSHLQRARVALARAINTKEVTE